MLIEKISFNEYILDCLNVRLFYLQNKNEPSEFLDNENKMEVLKITYQIEKIKRKLAQLNSEFIIQFEIDKQQIQNV
jgi:hypothetical protein